MKAQPHKRPYLFVGGTRNGKVIELDTTGTYVKAGSIKPAPNTELYTRNVFETDGHRIVVYVLDSMSVREAEVALDAALYANKAIVSELIERKPETQPT